MNPQPTVFLVDDDRGACRSMCWVFRQANMPVQAFNSAKEFLDAYVPDRTGCLVLDIRMPDIDGLELQQRMAAAGIRLPIIFLTGHGDVTSCSQAYRFGAFEFLEKPADASLLISRARQAIARDLWQRQVAQTAVEFGARLQKLSPRERHVFERLVAGESLKEIAQKAKITVQTAWKHRAAILRKTRTHNDVELARLMSEISFARSEPMPLEEVVT